MLNLPATKCKARARRLQAGQPSAVVINPVSCITSGSAVLFQDVSATSYPVYQKDSLLNSNPTFDFGEFKKLGEDLKSGKLKPGSKGLNFIFTFQKAGIYVFRDSEKVAKETVIAVMADGASCPTIRSGSDQTVIFEAQMPSALLRIGASKKSDIALTPDWAFFFGAVIAAMLLLMFLVVIASIIYNKDWS